MNARNDHIRTTYRAHAALSLGARADCYARRDLARIRANVQAADAAYLARIRPRAASVRMLYVAKRRRDAERERAARLAVCGLLPVVLAALVYFGGA